MRPSEVKIDIVPGLREDDSYKAVSIETAIEMARSYAGAVLINSVERLAWENKFKEWAALPKGWQGWTK